MDGEIIGGCQDWNRGNRQWRRAPGHRLVILRSARVCSSSRLAREYSEGGNCDRQGSPCSRIGLRRSCDHTDAVARCGFVCDDRRRIGDGRARPLLPQKDAAGHTFTRSTANTRARRTSRRPRFTVSFRREHSGSCLNARRFTRRNCWRIGSSRSRASRSSGSLRCGDTMNYHVLDARYVAGHVVWLGFRGGTTGEIDLDPALRRRMFEPPRDRAVFGQFPVHPEFHTLVWPNGAD